MRAGTALRLIGAAAAGSATAPGQVTGLAGVRSDSQVALSWTAPGDGGSAITDYTVQYRTTVGPGTWTTFSHVASSVTSRTVTGLTNGTSYDFQVAAVNAVGTGTYSAPITSVPAIIWDSFDRAQNTGSLSSADTGQLWTNSVGAWGIDANQAYAPTQVGGEAQATIDLGKTTQDVTVTASVANNDPAIAIMLRWQDSNNFYMFTFGTVSTIYKRIGGAFTGLASGGTPAASGDVMRFTVSGTTLTAYKNGTQVVQVTDAALSTGTKIGFRASQNIYRFNNLSAY